jgi:hypothetical protein
MASDFEAIKPLVQMSLRDTQALAGTQIKLDCVITGQPEPEVLIWKSPNYFTFKNILPPGDLVPQWSSREGIKGRATDLQRRQMHFTYHGSFG